MVVKYIDLIGIGEGEDNISISDWDDKISKLGVVPIEIHNLLKEFSEDELKLILVNLKYLAKEDIRDNFRGYK